MIKTIRIQNFKCFEHFEVDSCRPINVIVGDSGVGKTALLEAVFLALGRGAHNALSLRTRRGMDSSFSGSIDAIERAVWGDLFHDWDSGQIDIALAGDGPEARRVVVARGAASQQVSLSGIEAGSMGGIEVQYTAADGRTYVTRPTIEKDKGFVFPATGEQLPDFFFFGSHSPPSSSELASWFSALRLEFRERPVVDFLMSEYRMISDISVEATGGTSMLTAVVGNGEKRRRLPVNAISTSLARMASIALAIYVRSAGVVLVDELENGLYFEHQAGLWGGLLRLARDTKTQMFVTTHSAEFLDALRRAADGFEDDIALWRLSRDSSDKPVVRQFSGASALAALEIGSEVR